MLVGSEIVPTKSALLSFSSTQLNIKAVNKNNPKKFLKILIFIVVSLISCVLC